MGTRERPHKLTKLFFDLSNQFKGTKSCNWDSRQCSTSIQTQSQVYPCIRIGIASVPQTGLVGGTPGQWLLCGPSCHVTVFIAYEAMSHSSHWPWRWRQIGGRQDVTGCDTAQEVQSLSAAAGKIKPQQYTQEAKYSH